MRVGSNFLNWINKSDIVDRSHLFEGVNRASPPRITVIVAPPGYGKTILTAQYADYLGLPTVWHTVERWQANANQFLTTCIQHLSEYISDLDSVVELDADPQENYEKLAIYLRQNLKHPILYVIDECQYLNQNYLPIQWLQTLIQYTAGVCSFAICGQEVPNLILTQYFSQNQIFAIGQELLLLSNNDATRLAKQLERKEDEILKLNKDYSGWFAGIKLALSSLPQEILFSALGGTTGQALFDHIAKDLFNGLPPLLKEFLYVSALPDYFTEDMLRAVELINPRRQIQETVDRHLFVTKTDNIYRYHNLFRDYLIERYKTEDPTAYRLYHQRFAEWYMGQEAFQSAFWHFSKAEDWTAALKVVDYIVNTYFRLGQEHTLLQFYDVLHEVNICSVDLALKVATIHLNALNYDKAIDALDFAEQQCIQDNDEDSLVRIAILRAYIQRQLSNFDVAILQLTEILNQSVLSESQRVNVLHLIGQSYIELSLFEKAESYLGDALVLYEELNSQFGIAGIYQDLGECYMRSGQVDDAQRMLQKLLALRKSLGNPIDLAHAYNNLGVYYLSIGDYRTAESTLKEGLQISSTTNDVQITAFLLWNMGDARRDLGDFERALEYYDDAQQLVGANNPQLMCGILVSMMMLFYWQKNLDSATATIKSLYATALDASLAMFITLAQLMTAIVDIHATETDVIRYYEELIHYNNVIEVMRCTVFVLLYGLQNRSLQAINNAISVIDSIATSSAIIRPIIVGASFLEPVRKHFKSQARKYEKILTELEQLQDIQSQSQSFKLLDLRDKNRLEMHTLGMEQIILNGRYITPKEWTLRNARQLIYFLHFMGAQRRNDIALQFWQDSSTEKITSSMSTLVHRVRAVLGPAIVYDNGYYELNGEGYEIVSDAEQFERIVEEVRMFPLDDIRTEDMWRKALNLYQGEFLPGIEGEWIPPLREKYHEYYIQTLIGIGQCANNRKTYSSYDEAITYYRWAIKEDPYREITYRLLMICLANAKRYGALKSTYHELEQKLQDEIGTSISEETKRLYQKLIS